MENRKRIKLIIFTIIFSLILYWILIFVDISFNMFYEQAFGGGWPGVSGVLFYIASWPSLLLKVNPTLLENSFFNRLVITLNSTGWAVIGFVVGAIISTKKPERIPKVSTLRKELLMSNKSIRTAVILWGLSILFVTFCGIWMSILLVQPSPPNFVPPGNFTPPANPFLLILSSFIVMLLMLLTSTPPIMFAVAFIISFIIIIKNIKGNFLTPWQKISLWCIIIMYLFTAAFHLPFYFL